MKKLFVLIVLNLILFTNIYAQTGWFQQSCPTISYFQTVYFVNTLTGFASGGWPILKTTNGGNNWSVSYLPDTTSIIYSIRFLNSTTGYACGGRELSPLRSRQFLFKTTNTGESWIKVYEESSTTSSDNFNDVFAIDTLVYLTRGGYDTSGAKGGILLSQNSGINFTNIFLTNGETVEKLNFINSQTGWVTTLSTYFKPITQRKIFKTTNHGQNWTMQFRDSTIRDYVSNPNFQIQMINQNTGFGLYNLFNYCGNITKFIKTINGGLTWDSTIFLSKTYYTMFFVDANTGWIGGLSYSDSSNIIRTTNGGANWQSQYPNHIINSIFFVNTLTGWAVGSNGLIMKTVNSGVTDVKNISTEIPSSYLLSQNYPNPFNPTTNIKFAIPKAGDAKVIVYDVMGREVQTLVNERLQAGTYETTFDGSMLNSGVYFYKLMSDGFTETKRMILIK